MKLILLPALMILAISAPSLAQSDLSIPKPEAKDSDPFDPGVKDLTEQYQYVYEVFTGPKESMLWLMSEGLDDAVLHDRLLAERKAGKATLSQFMVLRGKAGPRVRLEEAAEFIYPTEFDPPEVPQVLMIAGNGPPEVIAADAPRQPRSPFNAGLGTITTTTPTALQMRRLGAQMEINPRDYRPGYGKVVQIEAEAVRFLGYKMANNTDQPVFRTAEAERCMTCLAGKPRLVGTFGETDPLGGEANAPNGPALRSVAFLALRPRHWVPNAAAGEKAVPAPGDPFAPGAPVPPPADDTAQEPLRIHFRIELYSGAQEVVTALFEKDLGDTRLHQEVLERAKTGAMEVENLLLMTTQSGQRMSMDTAEEFLYPTEFDPPELPQYLIIAHRGVLDAIRAGRETDPGMHPGPGASSAVGGFGLISTTSATAFEMRPVGDRVELDPVATDQGCDSSISLEICRLGALPKLGGIDTPIVSSQHLHTTVFQKWGETVLLGTLSPAHDTGLTLQNDTGRIWLAFLRVDRRDVN